MSPLLASLSAAMRLCLLQCLSVCSHISSISPHTLLPLPTDGRVTYFWPQWWHRTICQRMIAMSPDCSLPTNQPSHLSPFGTARVLIDCSVCCVTSSTIPNSFAEFIRLPVELVCVLISCLDTFGSESADVGGVYLLHLSAAPVHHALCV